jgi:shikimate dehydrogenase
VSGSTRTVGIIGWPVEHSLSPAIHNAAFVALGLDWTYVPLPVPPGGVPEALAGLRALGFAGANVTMPHKDAAAAGMDDLSADAALLRAVNTVVVGADGMTGHNTDAPGFERFLRVDAGFDPAGRTAVLFGAGGAARACALALARADLGRLVVVVRDPSRADRLRSALEGFSTALAVIAGSEGAGHPADLIVNATPADPSAGLLAVDARTVVVDLRYDPPTTPMQTAARTRGAATFGGLGLLLHQAALSFELWTGRPAPMEVMSAAALAAASTRA